MVRPGLMPTVSIYYELWKVKEGLRMPWSTWILAAFVWICNGFVRQRGRGNPSGVYFKWHHLHLHFRHLERTYGSFLSLICSSPVTGFAWGSSLLLTFQNTSKTWLMARQVVKQTSRSKASLRELFKQKSMKSHTQCTHGGSWRASSHHGSTLQIRQREGASILLGEECSPWQRGNGKEFSPPIFWQPI